MTGFLAPPHPTHPHIQPHPRTGSWAVTVDGRFYPFSDLATALLAAATEIADPGWARATLFEYDELES